jgi:signal transduction histidine kinase
MPERVQFRYILERFDKDWQEVGGRRTAFYSRLPPRSYRFRVIACNNDGIWNMAGATYEFEITPAFYQTSWFKVLVVIAAFLILGALYRFRLTQVARQLQLRYEERLVERTRIARELHDTLLQSFHGLILRFQAVRNMLPERAAQAVEALDIAIARAAAAITEGRQAVQELRSSQLSTNDLVEALTAMGQKLEADNAGATDGAAPATFRVLVEGTPRQVHPTVQDNLYRIAREAVSNAFRHARAHAIEVDIRYGRRMLRLRIRDDGIGVDPTLVFSGRRSGHWGLPGMRERAKSIGGHFELWSEARQGTEIEVTIPGVIAYRAHRDAATHVMATNEGGKQ